jgi:hypothetical protein
MDFGGFMPGIIGCNRNRFFLVPFLAAGAEGHFDFAFPARGNIGLG